MTNAQIFGREWLQSSFVSPVPVPAYYPSDVPLVCVQFNADWLPLVIGALSQLTQPAAWQGDDGTQDAAVQCANDLIGIFSAAYGGADCPMIRLTDGCELQESIDGGATWATIEGWDSNAMSCFVGPPGVPGSVGSIGPAGPGIPIALPGQSTTDLACAISGYLAQTVIRAALTQVVSGLEATQTAAAIFTAIVVAIFLGPEAAPPLAGAVYELYNLVNGGTIGDYDDAIADDTLWADVTCAIYNATAGTGYVNDDNFADVLTNVAAITYVHPAVITSLVSYLTTAGAIYLESTQIPGVLQVTDCSGCAGAGSNALAFPGMVGSNVVMASPVDYSGGAFTIGGWYNSSSSPGTWVIAILNYISGALPFSELYVTSGPTLNWFVESATDNRNGAGSLPSGSNVLFMATVGGGTQRLYVNGAMVSDLVPPAGTWETATGGVRFGDHPAGGDPLPATLWGWATYSSVLTGSDAAAWYAAGPSALPPGTPMNRWLMNEGSGTVVHDSAGSNDGTINGSVSWTTHT